MSDFVAAIRPAIAKSGCRVHIAISVLKVIEAIPYKKISMERQLVWKWGSSTHKVTNKLMMYSCPRTPWNRRSQNVDRRVRYVVNVTMAHMQGGRAASQVMIIMDCSV